MKICILIMLTLLTGCVYYDESTYITSDDGKIYHTRHYTLDKRAKSYFPKKIPSEGTKHFIFDPKVFGWAAYDEKGNRVLTGSASGGKDFCEDINAACRTITGSFRVYAKKGADCISREYPIETIGGAKMPYCIYFYRGFTIHAAYEVPKRNSSHGCIRVLPSAAKWLNEEFLTTGSRVTVLSYENEIDF